MKDVDKDFPPPPLPPSSHKVLNTFECVLPRGVQVPGGAYTFSQDIEQPELV